MARCPFMATRPGYHGGGHLVRLSGYPHGPPPLHGDKAGLSRRRVPIVECLFFTILFSTYT